jgi:membrane protein involved in colicin uptake
MTELSIEETSGVDHPAHLREGWLVMKSSDTESTTSVLDRIVKEYIVSDPTVAEKAMNAEDLREELDKAYARIEELEKDLSKTAKAEAAEEDEEEMEEEFMKSAPAPVARAFEKARKQAEEAMAKAAEAEAALKAERDEKADADAIAKASEWTHLSIDPAEFGPMMRRLAEQDAEMAKSVTTVLDSINAQAESANIFAEIGKSAPAPVEGDAISRITALAKAAVADGSATTVEQAMADVALRNPDLYMEYLTEKGA